MICKNCSAENEQGAKFCSNCGESFKDYENINTVLSSPEDTQSENDVRVPEQAVASPESAPVQPEPTYAPLVNSAPFGEIPSNNSGTFNAAPPAQPFGAPMPPVPPVPPVPQYPPQVPPYAQQAPNYPGQMPPSFPPPMPYGFQPTDPLKGKATGAKVCGILSIVLPLISCGIFWLIGLILGVIGISMGASYQNKVFEQNRSKARTGLICGIIGAVICVLIFIFSLILSKYMNSSEGQDIFKQFQEQFDTVIRPFIF